ncbi:hypothetical protein J8I87_20230 [Paraburkholderia sp. LEh10]|uniref:hypothetical protein n=1 Tax=Paraburkholderia sp. LEh10 TaxID=2821353 RepID=UPI001AE4F1E2|nr:hypothetical protein [Paraburkholderia sp. LEh10]MBP0592012.1 hypothetical protein [Paraburkholderia sp. LEh10]
MMISCMRCLYFIGHAAGGFFVWGSSGAGFFCFSHVLVSVFWVCLGRFDLPLSLFALPLALFDLPLALFDLPLALASAMRLAAQALPLCGAAPTFFAAAKKVGKESRSHRQSLTVTHGLSTAPHFSCLRACPRELPTHGLMPHPLYALVQRLPVPDFSVSFCGKHMLVVAPHRAALQLCKHVTPRRCSKGAKAYIGLPHRALINQGRGLQRGC